MTLGETDPALTYEAVGLVTGETLTGELTREAGEEVRTYTITQGTLTNENNLNYDITFTEGTFTIKAIDTSTATVEQVGTLTYNGKARRPEFTVKLGGTTLNVADYKVTVTEQTNVGNYTATITGRGNYTGTRTADWSIGKAAVTITANSYTIKVGDTLPTFEYKVTGLASNETLPITVTISCTATDSSTAGTFPITVSGAAESTNYAFTYVNGTLKITAKEIQTITADDVTMTYGDAGKKIDATTNGDGAISYAVTTGSDVISVAADGAITALKAGVATVEITAAETETYEQATTTVTVTVNKAAVTIKANDKTVKQGAALPAFDYTVTGLANDDTLSFTPVLTCEAADTSTVGTYAITVTIEITEDECYTYRAQNGTLTVQKKSSGGSSGGGSSRPTTPTEPNNPSIGGSSKSWSDVAADLAKLTNGSEVTITLNGNTTVPVEVIKVIAEKKLKATFVVDSVKSWKTDGAEITAPAAADLTILTTAKLKIDGLRGKQGAQFTMNNTNIPTDLKLSLVSGNEGKFANLYKEVSGKLVFMTCAKIGVDGSVVLPNVDDKGDYVAMLCEFSDRPGDMNNDGVMSAADASDVLKQIIGAANGANPAVADMNGDGRVTAADASEILKKIVCLA